MTSEKNRRMGSDEKSSDLGGLYLDFQTIPFIDISFNIFSIRCLVLLWMVEISRAPVENDGFPMILLGFQNVSTIHGAGFRQKTIRSAAVENTGAMRQRVLRVHDPNFVAEQRRIANGALVRR